MSLRVGVLSVLDVLSVASALSGGVEVEVVDGHTLESVGRDVVAEIDAVEQASSVPDEADCGSSGLTDTPLRRATTCRLP